MSKVKPSKTTKYLDVETWDAMKAAGYSEDELLAQQPSGPIIYSYSRAQAIEDGVLIDVTPQAKKAGFTVPAAMTPGVAGAMLELIRRHRPEAFEEKPKEVVEAAAYYGILSLLQTASMHAVRHLQDTQGGTGGNISRVDLAFEGIKLYGQIGPGDEGEPVLTVMLEGED